MEQVKNALFDISTCMQGLLAYQDAKWASDEISSLSTRKLQGWVKDKGYNKKYMYFLTNIFLTYFISYAWST